MSHISTAVVAEIVNGRGFVRCVRRSDFLQKDLVTKVCEDECLFTVWPVLNCFAGYGVVIACFSVVFIRIPEHEPIPVFAGQRDTVPVVILEVLGAIIQCGVVTDRLPLFTELFP